MKRYSKSQNNRNSTKFQVPKIEGSQIQDFGKIRSIQKDKLLGVIANNVIVGGVKVFEVTVFKLKIL